MQAERGGLENLGSILAQVSQLVWLPTPTTPSSTEAGPGGRRLSGGRQRRAKRLQKQQAAAPEERRLLTNESLDPLGYYRYIWVVPQDECGWVSFGSKPIMQRCNHHRLLDDFTSH